MRFITVLILCAALGFQMMAKLGVLAWYTVNKAYIAQNLCENKDRPAMHCDGKCYLKKQLKKTEGNQQPGQSEPSAKTEVALVYFILPAAWQVNTGYNDVDPLQHHSRYTSVAGTTNPADIFHPPPVA